MVWDDTCLQSLQILAALRHPLPTLKNVGFGGAIIYIYIYIYMYLYIYLYLYIYIFIYTLQRLKVPAKIIKLIQCFYSNPDFKVSVNGIDSDWKKQKTGIRQGCPLSPYLFCLENGCYVH